MSNVPFLRRDASSSSSRSTMLIVGLGLLTLWLSVITGVFVTWNNDNTKAVVPGPGLTAVRSGGNVAISEDFNNRMYTMPSPTVPGSPCGLGIISINPYVNGSYNFANTFIQTSAGGGFNGSQWTPQSIGVYTGEMRCWFQGTTIQPPNYVTVVYAMTLNGTSVDPYAGDTSRIAADGIVPYLPSIGGNSVHALAMPIIFHACPTCQFKLGQPIGIHMLVLGGIVADNIFCTWNICQND